MIIRTVLGDISPERLGNTLCHEHLFTNPPAWAQEHDSDMVLDNADHAVSELDAYAAAGGGAVVEMTTMDYGRDVHRLLEAARRTQVHVIAATGFQKGIYYPETVVRQEPASIAAPFVREVTRGIDGTPARAGVIKFGSCRTDQLRDDESRVMEATAMVHLATGVPISTHTQAGTLGLDQVAGFVAAGVDPGRVLVGHLDRNLDYGYLREVASTGAWLGLDHWLKPKYPSDERRAKFVERLLGEGLTQIMASGDFGRPSYQVAYGGGPGFAELFKRVGKLIGPEAAELVFLHNPRSFFAFEPRDGES